MIAPCIRKVAGKSLDCSYYRHGCMDNLLVQPTGQNCVPLAAVVIQACLVWRGGQAGEDDSGWAFGEEVGFCRVLLNGSE